MNRYLCKVKSLVLCIAIIFVICANYVNRQSIKNTQDLQAIGDLIEGKFAPFEKADCQISLYNPFYASGKKFFRILEPLQCKAKTEQLTYLDQDGKLKFTEIGLELKKTKNLICNYAELERTYDGKSDSFKVLDFKSFNSTIDLSKIDFIKVQCEYDKVRYVNFHYNIRDLNPPENVKESRKVNKSLYNVLAFGMDSVSRLNAMRQLPDAYEFIENNPNGFIMKGYTKIGANTYPNIATILTGYHPYEKPYRIFPIYSEKKPHDTWPFIWKNFSSNGYVTIFAEDIPILNEFDFERGGFAKPPTDYYPRYFWQAIEDYTDEEYCFNGNKKFEIHINYLKRFVDKYFGKRPFWAWSFMTGISHSLLNTIGYGRIKIPEFLKCLNDKNYLDDTFLFFFSDHGQRFDEIRQTYMGGIEDKMPLFSIIIPESFRRNHPEAVKNLKINKMRLTSGFDFYCTMMDIYLLSVNPSHKTGEFKTLHGLSLFSEIPRNRTCKEAGIDGEFCICNEEKEVSTDNEKIWLGVDQLIIKINDNLKSLRDASLCAELKLKRILEARLRNDKNKTVQTFIARFVTTPGDGMFESIFKIDKQNKTEITDNIERVNKYGNDGKCTSIAEMQPFCYCLK